ncbi:MAG TPA: hypothetical protein VGA08_04250 [Candidatus Saccharimonadales bacterium]
MADNKKIDEGMQVLQEVYQDVAGGSTEIIRHRQPSGESIRKQVKDVFADDRKAERVLAWSTLGIGIVALVFGFFYFQNQISSPNQSSRAVALTEVDPNSLTPEQEALAAIDTDEDGLSDYAELYIYSTSPYLPDTDSDGVTDKDEIERNLNPNCAFERNCSDLLTLTIPAEQDSALPGSPAALGDIRIEGRITAEKVRDLFLRIGVQPTQLEGLTDDQLLLAYEELIRRTGADTAPQVQPQPVAEPESIDELSATELRQLLLESGIPAEVLDEISDQELSVIVEQSLQTEIEN